LDPYRGILSWSGTSSEALYRIVFIIIILEFRLN
jgi:hypothetical protein